ncbi:divalent metal cation transporter [Hyphomicrobium sp.]|uniref:NRAMP family divalent metal transporter n=1 Tax=Hyphomicrobium sp. TaxID=82 RepID=UPI001DEE2822|nr:divalent metal cation transporter [Hyphomicrobium sp.]MBY0562373.1 divalent metal cation transporter [Hyphomicrobium sp.]
MNKDDPEVQADAVVGPSKPRLLRVLGPGLITGASDDDPSGIATYSQAGALFGYSLLWTMLLTYPLMVAVQEISARIGRTTGKGICGNIIGRFPAPLIYALVGLLFFANVINIGADLGAMGDAGVLLMGGPRLLYVVGLGAICILMQIFLQYARYVSVLKWLALALFAYVATLFAVRVSWGDALTGLLLPNLSMQSNYWQTVVAIFGTTISPYLFFWQASQEVEDINEIPRRQPLNRKPQQAKSALQRIRLDTAVGMAFSNLVAISIMMTVAATLHVAGKTNIESSAQAAEALRPIAGDYAFLLFAAGIVGTGLLSIPVLAGSAAYAAGETFRWRTGLALDPREGKAFYATIAVATIIGTILNFTPIDPIKALFYSAVVNGLVAVPVLIAMLILARDTRVMKTFRIQGMLLTLGWITVIVMGAAAAAMGAQFFAG